MTHVVYTFENGPAEGPVTAANSGVTLVSATGGSATYDANQKETGAFSARLTTAGSSQALVRAGAAAEHATMSFGLSFRVALSNPSGYEVGTLRHAAGRSARIQVESNGTLQFRDINNANYLTIATGLVAGNWYRLSGWVIVGGTAQNVSLNLYGPSSNTPINASPITATAYDLGTAPIAAGDFGVVSTPVDPLTSWVDNIQFSEGVAQHLSFYDPVVEVPPPVIANTRTVRHALDFSTTTGEAPLTLTASQVSGPSVGTITITGMVAEFVDDPERTTSVVIAFTVTDSLGQTSTENITVPPWVSAPNRIVLRGGVWR